MIQPNLKNFRHLLILVAAFYTACSQLFTISVNNQPVYDPTGRLSTNEVINAELQGCINLAMRQQNVNDATELTALSCRNSEISDLERIGQLGQLRFLDLANNNISNITPLEELPQLGGLNLNNNLITDIRPLLNISSLTSVSLLGNDEIPCNQVQLLRERFNGNLILPENCKN